MKTLRGMFPFRTFPSALRFFWLLALAVMISSQAHGQSSGLAECRRAFYRGDYVQAAELAENKSEAEEEFQKALKANPRSIEVSTELAELKRSQSKFDEAIVYYTQAEQIGPLHYEIAYGLGACYTYKQEYSRAIEWLRKAVALAPDSAAGRFALGNALFQNGQSEAAIPELNVSLQLEPRMKQAYFLLGRAYSKVGRLDEAKAALKKLDELNRAEMPGQEKVPPATPIQNRARPK